MATIGIEIAQTHVAACSWDGVMPRFARSTHGSHALNEALDAVGTIRGDEWIVARSDARADAGLTALRDAASQRGAKYVSVIRPDGRRAAMNPAVPSHEPLACAEAVARLAGHEARRHGLSRIATAQQSSAFAAIGCNEAAIIQRDPSDAPYPSLISWFKPELCGSAELAEALTAFHRPGAAVVICHPCDPVDACRLADAAEADTALVPAFVDYMTAAALATADRIETAMAVLPDSAGTDIAALRAVFAQLMDEVAERTFRLGADLDDLDCERYLAWRGTDGRMRTARVDALAPDAPPPTGFRDTRPIHAAVRGVINTPKIATRSTTASRVAPIAPSGWTSTIADTGAFILKRDRK